MNLRPTAAPGAAAPAARDFIKDATIESFERDVLEASMTAPVIVDFWAEWCGPCRQLTPMLEKAVTAANGAVRLVKVDIDKNKMLATQMRIQSVPTVYAFLQGRPVDGFQGAIPESQVKTFIQRLADAARQLGPAPDAADLDLKAVLDAADEALAAGDAASAAQAYAEVAQIAEEAGEETFLRALAGLARCRLATGDVAGAREALTLAPPAKQNDAAFSAVRAQIELAEKGGGDVAGLRRKAGANPKDFDARFALAEALAAGGDMPGAIDELIAMVTLNRAWNDEAARKKLLQIFEALGPKHPDTLAGRRRLSSALFA
ncbi:MAG TPA: co-chaperone YbbN [Parvularcula sp.]|nr:co-chaperone YbbN [Parvularcula sp.]HBS31192.1 co-chaperone YbbN [Parvularcula sp.]